MNAVEEDVEENGGQYAALRDTSLNAKAIRQLPAILDMKVTIMKKSTNPAEIVTSDTHTVQLV